MIIGMELMDSKSGKAQDIPLEWMTEKYNTLVKEGLPYEAIHFQYVMAQWKAEHGEVILCLK